MRLFLIAFFLLLMCVPIGTTFAASSDTGSNFKGEIGSTGINMGNGNGGANHTLLNPLGQGSTLSSFVSSILQLVVKIGAIVVIFMLVYVGFLFVVARGEPEQISHARQALLYTVIGALVLLGAQAIALGIQSTVQALSTGG